MNVSEHLPNFHSTQEELSAYYRSVTVGDLACILASKVIWNARPSFRFARVNDLRPRQGLIITDVGYFYAKSGVKYRRETDDRLIIPTLEILEWGQRNQPHVRTGHLAVEDVRAKLEGRITTLPSAPPPPPPPTYTVEEATQQLEAAKRYYETADVRANNPNAYRRVREAASAELLQARNDLERARKNVEQLLQSQTVATNTDKAKAEKINLPIYEEHEITKELIGPVTPERITEARRYRYHKHIERNSQAPEAAKKYHGYRCQACKIDFEERYGEIGRGFIEAHHLIPLSSLPENEKVTYVVENDFAVLCSNCHRMIHRSGNPADLEGFRKLVQGRIPG